MPRLSVAWVMLQRVPPDMRILTPGLRFFSRSSTRRPCSAALIAAISPAAPAPTTMTSQNESDMPIPPPDPGPSRPRPRVPGEELAAQVPVAEPAADRVVQGQQRPDEPGQEGLRLALDDQSHDAIDA